MAYIWQKGITRAMHLEDLRTYCLSFTGVTEDIKWEHNLCFSVGGKIFLIANPDAFPVSVAVKTTAEDFASLTGREGISPAPYLARNHWILIKDIAAMGVSEMKAFIRESYTLVLRKLPKKLQQEIEG